MSVRCHTGPEIASPKLHFPGLGHELKATWAQRTPQSAGDLHQASGLRTVGGRRQAHATVEERAEASEARAANVKADAGDGVAPRQQLLCPLDASTDTSLVRRLAEQACELADEHTGRQSRFFGKRRHRDRCFSDERLLAKPITRPTQKQPSRSGEGHDGDLAHICGHRLDAFTGRRARRALQNRASRVAIPT